LIIVDVALAVFEPQALADGFEHGQIEGLTDETTIGQLAGLLTEFDSHGRTRIESKEDARQRGVPSPDSAEALMLALGKPLPVFDFYSIRDLPRLSGRSPEHLHAAEAHPFWGFTEVPYDEKYPSLPRRWPRGSRGF
jgi:hypothetical protein